MHAYVRADRVENTSHYVLPVKRITYVTDVIPPVCPRARMKTSINAERIFSKLRSNELYWLVTSRITSRLNHLF
jgi:hypothetical protein